MHIPAKPRQTPILPAAQAGGDLETLLWQRLAPERWPVRREDFPPGTALVGGAVRDALLGRLAHQPDLDLVVPNDAIGLARQLARRRGGTCVVLDAQRDMARLVLAGWTVDLARQEGADLPADLRRRDYSANALALPLQAGTPLVDPTGGLQALRQGLLVAVDEANLLDDPLRLLRGVRLAWELELQLDATSLGWIRQHASLLTAVAGERVLGELKRLACCAAGHHGLEQAMDLGLLQGWGADAAAAAALQQLSISAALQRGLNDEEANLALPLARLATLLPAAAVQRLRGSRRLQQSCGQLRHGWLQLAASCEPSCEICLDNLAEPVRLQLQRDLECDLPALLLRLPAAHARAAMERWRDADDPLFHPRAPLNGTALCAALGLKAGPELGSLIEQLTRERAFGRIPASGAAQEPMALLAAQRLLDARRG
jgi:tRNA nucleotidyltransferase (CCA-adding enzyme)